MEIKLNKLVNFVMVLLLLIMLAVVSSADPVNVELVSRFSGSYSDVAVNGNYAYLLQDRDLAIVDITNPTNPDEIGRITTPSTAYEIAVVGNYAYVADDESGLIIIDISNPASPAIKGSCTTAERAGTVCVSSNYAYVDGNGLMVLDITNPSAPTLVGSYDIQGGTSDVTVSGKYAYVLVSDYTDESQDSLNDLVILDISNPASPEYIGHYGYRNNDELMSEVSVSGNYAYVSINNQLIGHGRLEILDISDHSSPYRVAVYDVPNPEDLVLSGNYVYITRGDGLSIADTSNPLAPTTAGSYNGNSWGTDVAVSGSYIYLTENSNGLAILRMSTDSGTESPAPLPFIASVDIEPVAGVSEGDIATIKVSVINNGGPSNEGYIVISFPNNEEVTEVSGTGSEYNKLFPIGSTIYGKTGSMTSSNPVAGLSESSWASGQTETLTIKVKPNTGSSKIEFYVRSSLKDGSGNDVRTPASSANTDQQGWYVDMYSVNVLSSADITPPASVQGLQQSEVDSARIKWTWTNPSDADFSHVMVYIDGAFATTTSETYYELTGLTESTTHTIGLQTVDTSGNINTEIVNDEATTAAVLPAITSLSGKAIDTSSTTLEWEASSDTTRVQIFRDNALITDISGSSSYVDSNLESSTTYSYTLVPYNIAGVEGNAVTINLKTPSSGSSGSGGGGSGSSSSSGGGGGAGSVEDYENVAAKDVDNEYLTMDSNVLYEFSREGNDILSVSFYSLKNSGEITASIEVLNGKSKMVTSDPTGLVYKYINIWLGKSGFATASNIQDAKIKFKVDAAWLQAMDLSPEDVKLQVYSGNAWQILPTTLYSTTSDSVIFEAQTTAFGAFAITAEQTIVTPVTPNVTDTKLHTTTSEDTDMEETEPRLHGTGSEYTDMGETEPEKSSIWKFAIGILAIGIVVVGYMYVKRE